MKNIMENIIDGKLKLVINTITNQERKKEILLNEDEYFISGNNPVIKHDALVRISESEGFCINEVKLEFGVYNSNSNFCFVHRAFGVDAFGHNIDEVGEANPTNLTQDISMQYPAIMSNKRAQDRLFIRMLGLQGQAYSQEEIGYGQNKMENIVKPKTKDTSTSIKDKINKSNTINSPEDIQKIIDNIPTTNNKEKVEEKIIEKQNILEDNTNNEELKTNVSQNIENFDMFKEKCSSLDEYELLKSISDFSIEEAENMIIDFGKFRKDKPTLQSLKEQKPIDFEWLLKTYKISSSSSEKMKRFKKAAIMIA